VLEPRLCGVAKVEKQILDHEEIIGLPTGVACESLVLGHMLGLVSPSYLGMLVGARKREGNFASRMLRPKARGPRWLGDQLRSWSSSLLWRRQCPRSSSCREWWS
jgi:hypothetical protein